MTPPHDPRPVLGIETSCDETAAAVVVGRRVLSNMVATQHDLHAEYGGVVPEIASRAHVERITPVIARALDDAGVCAEELAGVAVGHRPGLIGSLLVGVGAAKALSWSLGVPLVGVDHVHAHLFAPLLNGPGDADPFPALGLVVSGGHTTFYRCESAVDFMRLGGTIDDAVGEAFDKAAQILGLGHPGGPAVDRLASSPGARPERFDLPVSLLDADTLDTSFSGLKTSLLYKVRGNPIPKKQGGGFDRDHNALSAEDRRDLAAAFQHAACSALVIKLDRALDQWQGQPPQAVLVGGGVSANSLLRRTVADLAERRGLTLSLAPPEYCIDNAAMIAGLGAEMLRRGVSHGLDLEPAPTTSAGGRP